jgi:hypothetical protein
MITPFHTSEDTIAFPWKPTGDRAFIYPSPPPETFIEGGLIEIPEPFREEYRQGYGILLAVGPGFTDPKGRWKGTLPDLYPGCYVVYDVSVPWRAMAKGQDGENHLVIMCGTGDILGVQKEESAVNG